MKDIIPEQNLNLPFNTFSFCQWIKIGNFESSHIYQVTKFNSRLKYNNDDTTEFGKEIEEKYDTAKKTKVFSLIEVK